MRQRGVDPVHGSARGGDDRPACPPRRKALAALASWTSAGALAGWLGVAALPGVAGCERRRPRAQPVAPGATVLALGDSLTHGTGAPPDAAYPAVLAALTGWNVVNAGVPGDTSAGALERLPSLLEAHRPALVLVRIGGNDFLRRLDETLTREHVRRICETARAAGAQVLLIAVPRPSLGAALVGSLADHDLYGELADALGLPLHAGGWAGVLAEERLRADRIHANAEGYAEFARGLAATARALGLLSS